MPDKQLEFPVSLTGDELGQIKHRLSVQDELTASVAKEHQIREKMGILDESMESRLLSRVREQRKLTSEYQRDLILVGVLELVASTLDKARRKHLDGIINSIKDKIDFQKEEIQILEAVNKREMEDREKKMAEEKKWQNFAGSFAEDHLKIKVKEFTMVRNLMGQLQNYPFLMKMGAVWGAVLLTVLAGAWSLFKSFDTAAWELRKALGMSRAESAGLKNMAEKMAIEYAHVGVSIAGAYESIKSLRNEMGSAWTITEGLVQNVSILSAQLGVSEANSAGFLRNMASVSQSTMQSQENMMYMAANLSRSAGVPLNEVMGDIATKSDTTLTMVSRLPKEFLRTAIEARRLNTTIDNMAKASRSILNFQESVNAEMDASVLLGRSINLQRARELAYRRDLEGSTKEILRITKQVDFENLDVFQQEAFAKATGRSVDELLKMVQAERLWEKARKDPKLAEKVKQYEALRAANEKTAKDQATSYELELKRRGNQEKLTKISNQWNQIMMEAQSVLLPLISIILDMVIPIMYIVKLMVTWRVSMDLLSKLAAAFNHKIKVINLWLALGLNKLGMWRRLLWAIDRTIRLVVGGVIKLGNKIGSLFSSTGKLSTFGKAFASIGKAAVWVGGKIARLFSFIKGFSGAASTVGKLGINVGKFFGFLGFAVKWVPILGWVITALQVIYHLFKRWKAIFDDPNMNIVQKIFAGIWAIPMAIYDALLKPFVGAFKWIMSLFGGRSPSVLALNILKGIVAIGASLFDAITAPWRLALAWIFSKIPGMGKIAGKLAGGIRGSMSNSVEKKVGDPGSESTITAADRGAARTSQTQTNEAEESKRLEEDKHRFLHDILEGINLLNKNLESGKIGFYVDGQLLSATIARQTEFRGGYGVNKI